MQTTTLKLKTATVRPSRVIATVVIELLLAEVGSWLYHPVMVKLHGGTWCMRIVLMDALSFCMEGRAAADGKF
jgi:hypothetical protein